MENGFGDLEIWREIYLGRNSLLERKSFLYNMMSYVERQTFNTKSLILSVRQWHLSRSRSRGGRKAKGR